MIETLRSLFIRDLERLKQEISSFSKEENMWKLSGDIKNSSGTLCLHLLGNLNHFVGAVLLKSGYVRNREAEFSDRNISQAVLIRQIENTIQLFETKFEELHGENLDKPYPIEVFGSPMSTGYFLIHLQGHLNYHLGQVNYHRRLLDT